MSSARAVRCSIKLGNERNPYCVLQVSHGTAQPQIFNKFENLGLGGRWGRRQISMALDALGDTRATMAGTTGCEVARRSQSLKTGPSSDWSLQLDSMKSESLVMAHQPWRREYVPGSCTHRPSRQGSR